MSFWKKSEIRTEEFFYEYLKGLTSGEMLNLSKAMIRIMDEVNSLSLGTKKVKDKDDRREIS